MKRCDICDGSRVIRLPVRHEVSARVADYAASPADMMISSRTYPCPECASGTSSDRLAIIEVGAEHILRWPEEPSPEMMEAMQESTAHRMVGELLRNGLISFRKHVAPDYLHGPGAFTITAKLGAVSPAQVATFEERVIAHQDKIAQDLADLAMAKIAHWGSDYTDNEGPIHKSTAIRSVRNALEEIRKRKP